MSYRACFSWYIWHGLSLEAHFCFKILKKFENQIFSKRFLYISVIVFVANMVLLCFIYRFKAIATSTKVLSFEILSANRPNRRENRKKTPSKKNPKQNWGVYIEKTQHGDLDIIIRQPSMFSFFPFFMMPVLGVFFWRIS